MILRNTKLLIGVAILSAYIGIGVLGLFEFSHMAETPMPNCPYTNNNFSLCENVLDHITKWQQFSSTIFPFLSIFLILILGIILYFIDKQNFFNPKLYFYRWKYYLDRQILNFYRTKFIKWLSLFENSPALSYIGYS